MQQIEELKRQGVSQARIVELTGFDRKMLASTSRKAIKLRATARARRGRRSSIASSATSKNA